MATTIEWKVPIIFRSALDEKAFFSWLLSIPGIQGVEGKGRTLLIYLHLERLSKAAMRELAAIYRRYGGNMKELARFDTPRAK